MNRKIIFCISLCLILLCFFMASSYAWNPNEKIDTISNQDIDAEVEEKTISIGSTVINVTQIICFGVALVMLIALAIKYMVASAGDRADIKKHAVVYITGAIVMFSATGILEIIQKFAETNITVV